MQKPPSAYALFFFYYPRFKRGPLREKKKKRVGRYKNRNRERKKNKNKNK